MRILIHSNPMVGSGYGEQTALLASRLPGLGHEPVISATSGLEGRALEWNGIPILPSGMRPYGNDTLAPHARRMFGGDPGLILVLCDAWTIEPEPLRGFATALWAPICSDPVPPKDLEFFAISGALPIAMSRYGERVMARAGMQPVYVPHSVDTQVFKPLTADERATARDMLGVPQDAFVIAIVAANKDKTPARKGWGEQLEAFARFRERRKDSVLLIHSLMNNGVDLRPLIYDLGIQDSVQFTDQYSQVVGLYRAQDVAGIMGCADVLSNCSWAEGFGLAPLEAQACGVPVVVGDNSAQTELCGSGWLVECQPYWHPFAQSRWHCPSIKGITAAYEKAYKHARDPAMREKARGFALGYDVDTVLTQYWKPALEMLEQYAGAVPVRPPNRNHGTIPLPTAEADGLTWIQRGGNTDDGLAIGHEESLTPVLDGLLPDGGVFLDVGAHVGHWSLRLAGKASRVIAVEANPATAAVQRAHIEMNGISNVEILQVAAWDAETTLDLSDPHGMVTGGSTRTVPQGPLDTETQRRIRHERTRRGLLAEDVRGVAVPARPLDSLLGGESRIDLVKLDVEGADLHALRGMRDTLARCKPVLFIEDHSIYGYYDLADLKDLLAELGYDNEEFMAPLPGGRHAPYIIARPKEESGG